MSKNLKPKEREFIDEYLSNGNKSTEAAMKVFGLSYEAAAVKASRLIKSDKFGAVLNKGITDEDLQEAHRKLLNHKRVEYFVFPRAMKDDEITDKVESAGLKIIVIKDGEKGRYAFYSNPDPAAVSKALDMSYKIKGTYAPEKKEISGQLEVISTERLEQLADQLNGE
jgi:hypothetical protein